MMFHAVSDLDGDDYLELYNRGTDPVDLSGWTFSGITLTLPAGTTIAAGGYLVVAKDAVQFQATYGFAPAAVYGGNLSNSGETVALRDATAATIDTVSFLDVDPWPVKADGTGPSLELIDATLDNNDSLNWAAATNAAGRTPGAANSVRRTGLGPRITNVVADPASNPAANQPVTVTATITGQTTAVLRYRIDFNAEQTLTMTATAAPDTYTATIPGAAAGHLIRYRVEATNANATTRVPRIDDTIVYRGLVVPSGITSPIPQWEWFIAPADYTTMVNNPTQEIIRYGAIAYAGRVYRQRRDGDQGPRLPERPQGQLEVQDPVGLRLRHAGPVRRARRRDRHAGRLERPLARPGHPVVGRLPARRLRGPHDVPRPHPAQRRLPGPLQPPGDLRRHLARARGLRRQPVLRGRDERLLDPTGQRAVLQEGTGRDRLRADRGVRQRRPADRHRPARLPARPTPTSRR